MRGYKKLAISSILLTLLISGLVWARPVNKTEAEKAVKGWLKTDPKPLNAILGSEVETTDVFSGDDGIPVYYVVYLKPSGFVIVSADDIVEPVVCFVTGDAYYDPSPENPLGAIVSQDLPRRVDSARKLQKDWDAGKDLAAEETAMGSEAIKVKDKWSKLQNHADSIAVMNLAGVSDVRVAPLLQSGWGQDAVCNAYCYNYYTPNHYVCGCVATAMAQFMRYYQWPATGIGVHSFSISVDGHPQTANTRGGDGNGGPYYWDRMVLVPDCSITAEQRNAIGSLCYDTGVASHMDYASGGSGAYMHDAKAALLNTFFYTNAIMGGNESKNIGSGLNGMINPDLDAGYPVLLGIWKSGVGGHAVVADGYGYNASTLYHHINMGWNGLEDAWYNLPNIDSSPSFNVIDTCIYNVYTSGSGEIISGRVTDSSGQPLSGATVTAQGRGGTYNITTNNQGIYALEKVNSSSSYTISVTKEGYSFTYKVIVTGTSTEGQLTSGNQWGVNFAATAPLPQPPSSINYPSSSSTGKYTVAWSSSATATSYQLQRSSNGGSSWLQVYSGSNTSYQENIGNGSYRYRVEATNSAGSSGWTTGTLNCVVSIAPQPPSSINYPSSSNTGTYTVTWSSSVAATSYQLQRSSNGGSSWLQVYSGSNTSYHENIGNGSYRYRVEATNSAGSSGWTTGTLNCVVSIKHR